MRQWIPFCGVAYGCVASVCALVWHAEMDVDPKVVADLMGHDVNVNLNAYTQTSIETKLEAVEVLESAFVN
jgi:hypothetical protein